jgi:hypothetical protein
MGEPYETHARLFVAWMLANRIFAGPKTLAVTVSPHRLETLLAANPVIEQEAAWGIIREATIS